MITNKIILEVLKRIDGCINIIEESFSNKSPNNEELNFLETIYYEYSIRFVFHRYYENNGLFSFDVPLDIISSDDWELKLEKLLTENL